MKSLPSKWIGLLREAGWFAGRRVSVSGDVPSDHPAYAVLAEFGELQITRSGILEFDFKHIADVEPEIEQWAQALNTRFVGIAEVHNAHGGLYMTGSGLVIGVSYIHPACWFEGRTIEDAIARVLSRTHSRPMLLPAQTEVILYGQVFNHGDSEVITPASPELQI